MTSDLSESEKKAYPNRREGVVAADTREHKKCLQKLEKSVNSSSYVRYMLDALKKAGCELCVEEDIVCEPCGSGVAGGYDPATRQVVLCENQIIGPRHVNDILTHELVHVFDECRANVDWDNLQHVACSEIRAASLSGECFFSKETFGRLRFGWRKHHQDCVRYRAAKSVGVIRENVSEEEAHKIVDSVFDSCFKDTTPFEHVPP